MKDVVNQGSLIIVGTGIKLGEHLTQEARNAIKSADRVFATVADAATFHWLKTLNPDTQSLQFYYDENKDRLQTYEQMVDTIAASVVEGNRTCAVFYGHPGVFVYPSHAVIERLQQQGYSARMLPGISSDACLFADLGVDPATNGCQSYEATDFLLFNRQIDPTVACIIWQIGVIGEFNGRGIENTDIRFQIFIDELQNYYPDNHQVILYEASQFNLFQPKIVKVALEALRDTHISRLSTLYIPPTNQKRINYEIAKLLQIDISRFC